jgi:hypothetical protein
LASAFRGYLFRQLRSERPFWRAVVLFELGGDTIWAPAILHFIMQGTVKVVTFHGEGGQVVPIVWMVACATLPYLVFLRERSVVLADTARGAVHFFKRGG